MKARFALLALPAAIAVCGGIALAASVPRSGEQVFNDKCVLCHDAGGWGTRSLAKRVPKGEAELLRRKDLPPAYTKIVVRRGIGSMPQFTPTDLSDADLDAVAIWLEQRN